MNVPPIPSSLVGEGQGGGFDALAATYDAGFTQTPLGRRLRARVWACLERHFRPGQHILEVGCGTGEDAIWLAQRGISVTATDASAEMLMVAERKAARAGVAGRVVTRQLALEALAEADFERVFDGLLSDFGALNCVAPEVIARTLGRWVRPGGRAVLVVMGPCCPWEIAWFLLHGHPRTAFRRLRPGGVTAEVGGQKLRVFYPSPGRLARMLAPEFRLLRLWGLGVALPTTDAANLVDRRPGLLDRLDRLETRLAGVFPFRLLGDHYVLELERLSTDSGNGLNG
jgi:ubiquinone/menaquinone biosynthesis C-methylase UbiE